MKRTLTIISAALMSAALSLPMIAQASPTYYPPVNTGYGEHHPYVEGFDDNYLDSHPDVRAELARNPRLIDDPAYMANHPELRDYMHNHPREAEAYRSHPDRFMHREHVYNHSVRRWDSRHDVH
jgi:hypothetical protein